MVLPLYTQKVTFNRFEWNSSLLLAKHTLSVDMFGAHFNNYIIKLQNFVSANCFETDLNRLGLR